MIEQKLSFLKDEFIPLVKKLHGNEKGKWGKMNAQQMTEHVSAFFKVSTEKIKLELVTPEEHLPKYKEFLFSEKRFRENTKAPATIIDEEPFPVHYKTMNEAVDKLEKETNFFFAYFKNDANKKTLHPVFGELDFDEWILLHYKHVTHHLRQFGLIE